MTKKKILFIKYGSFSHINEQVIKQMEKSFVDFQIDVVDIEPFFENAGLLSTLSFYWYAFLEFGIPNFKNLKKFKNKFKLTARYWDYIQKKLKILASNKNYEFSIQTQSSYDANIGKWPHYIYTDHTHLVNLSYPDFDKNKLKPKSWIEKEKTLYNRASSIFTMSSHVKSSLIYQYDCPSSKVHCVHAGASIFREDKTYPLERYQKKTILFVGIDWERKGGPQLLEAFKLVLKKHLDAKLIIVGSFPDVNHPNIRIVGRIPLKEVSSYYENASVFCMPSKNEPFGIVYLEAMSYKLPIVALKIGALPDFVGEEENGYLVDYLDIQSLAEKLIHLLDNPVLCLEMGGKAYKKFKNTYQWKTTVTKIKNTILANDPLIDTN